jgi:hypothetical protein
MMMATAILGMTTVVMMEMVMIMATTMTIGTGGNGDGGVAEGEARRSVEQSVMLHQVKIRLSRNTGMVVS